MNINKVHNAPVNSRQFKDKLCQIHCVTAIAAERFYFQFKHLTLSPFTLYSVAESGRYPCASNIHILSSGDICTETADFNENQLESCTWYVWYDRILHNNAVKTRNFKTTIKIGESQRYVEQTAD